MFRFPKITLFKLFWIWNPKSLCYEFCDIIIYIVFAYKCILYFCYLKAIKTDILLFIK